MRYGNSKLPKLAGRLVLLDPLANIVIDIGRDQRRIAAGADTFLASTCDGKPCAYPRHGMLLHIRINRGLLKVGVSSTFFVQ